MALFLFTKAMLEGKPIKIFNSGEMVRDFTYVDDIVESLLRLLKKSACSDTGFDPQRQNPSTSWAPYRVFKWKFPTPLMDYIYALEKALDYC